MTRAAKSRSVAGIVLAGGQSRRMGRDKADILFRGQTFIAHARSQLSAIGCNPVIVSGRPDLPDGIADQRPGHGPAQAVYDALTALPPHCDGALFIPVDMPLLETGDLAPLLDCEPGTGCAWIDHPLPLFLPTGLPLPARESVRSVRSLLAALPMSWRTFDPEQPARFANLNTQAELTAALKMR